MVYDALCGMKVLNASSCLHSQPSTDSKCICTPFKYHFQIHQQSGLTWQRIYLKDQTWFQMWYICNLQYLPSLVKPEGWICWHRPGRSRVEVCYSWPQDHHPEQCGQTDWKSLCVGLSSTGTSHQLSWLQLQWGYGAPSDGVWVSPHLVVHMLQCKA